MSTPIWFLLQPHPLALFLAALSALVGYHLWQWGKDHALAQRLKATAPTRPVLKATPRVTILVAAWNETAHLAEHLHSIQALRYPNLEYVLCAGGRDGTYALARHLAPLWMQVLKQHPGEGKQQALRRSLSYATGEIIFLTDADTVLTDTAFECTLAPLINEAEAVATGTSEPLPAQKTHPLVLEHWFTDVYVQAHSGAYTRGLLGRNVALTRQALHAAGDLQAIVDSGTDYHLAKTLLAQGYAIRYVPQSSVPTVYPASWTSHAQRQTRWLRNVVVYGWHFRAYDEVFRSLLPSGVGLTMLFGGVVAWWQGGGLLILWTLLLLHALLSRWRYMRFGTSVTGLRFRAYGQLPVTLLADFAVWTRALLQYVVPAWRRQW